MDGCHTQDAAVNRSPLIAYDQQSKVVMLETICKLIMATEKELDLTPGKRPNSLRIPGKYHACLMKCAWYMHVLIHYLEYDRTLPGTFHAWNSTPVIVCYTQGTCMLQVLHLQ